MLLTRRASQSCYCRVTNPASCQQRGVESTLMNPVFLSLMHLACYCLQVAIISRSNAAPAERCHQPGRCIVKVLLELMAAARNAADMLTSVMRGGGVE